MPKTKKQNECIMVVLDKLRKGTHFIPLKSTYKTINIAYIFMRYIFRLHGIPKTIITDWDAKFTSNLQMSLFKGIDTKLNFCTTYHPQTDG